MEKLKIALIEPDDSVAKKIKVFFGKRQNEVELVEIFKMDARESLEQKLNKDINALVVNIFNYSEGIDIINLISDEKRPIPVCLLGTREQLIDFSGIDKSSKERLRYYCNLKTDEEDLEIKVKDMSSQLLGCRKAKVKKSVIQRQISEKLGGNIKMYEAMRNAEPESQRKKYKNFEENAKEEAKKEAGKFVLGMDVDKLDKLIDNTLSETSKTIKQYKWVNLGIIIFGAILISGAAICEVVLHTDTQNKVDYLAFGGFGLVGIIASLITNPTSSINKTVRQKLQIQMSYFSFLKQIEILNKVQRSDDTIEIAKQQSECLEKATKSLQETLFKYFDEHKKTKEKPIDD